MGGYVLVVVVAWTQDAPNGKVFCEAWKGKGFHAIDRRALNLRESDFHAPDPYH